LDDCPNGFRWSDDLPTDSEKTELKDYYLERIHPPGEWFLIDGAWDTLESEIMKYCSECASPVSFKVPSGDTLPRFVCEKCGRIFYENPKIVVGTIPRWKDQVLICKRSIEPRRDYWTLPSGYLEKGETVEEGALRETWEEARAKVSIIRLFAVFSLPHVNQVYLAFLADLQNRDFEPGEESLEVKLVDRNGVPWDQIAFRAIEFFLERYFLRGSDEEIVHCGSWQKIKGGSWIRGGNR
jgi:ADP-ribose pyrophosphatase YjhB (NUDIX family)